MSLKNEEGYSEVKLNDFILKHLMIRIISLYCAKDPLSLLTFNMTYKFVYNFLTAKTKHKRNALQRKN